MNYVLIGAGGTGSHLFTSLYKYLKAREKEDPEWFLYIIDGDHVTTGNILRQNFVLGDVEANKAEALAERVNDPDHIQAIPKYLGAEEMARYITDGDVVFIGADNFWVRKLVNDHVMTLQNSVVINGGNELISGSVQIHVRRGGKNITPRITHMHAEIANANAKEDRAVMSCAQIAELPGGEQTILANMTSATFMLAALWRLHNNVYNLTGDPEPGHVWWTELQFDHKEGTYVSWDVRNTKNWDTDA